MNNRTLLQTLGNTETVKRHKGRNNFFFSNSYIHSHTRTCTCIFLELYISSFKSDTNRDTIFTILKKGIYVCVCVYNKK